MRVSNSTLTTNQILNANYNSPPQQLNQVFGYAIQGEITGTPTGTFTLQSSVDSNFGNVHPVNWTTVDNSSQAVSASGNFTYNVHDAEYNWVRLVYTDGSGGASTATLSAQINTKGF